MYSSRAFSKMLSWLLATAIAVQPVSGFSCGCGGAKANSGPRLLRRPSSYRSSVRRCGCCCCSAPQGELAGKPQRTPPPHHAKRDKTPAGVCTCKCGPGTPAAPQSVPAQHRHTDDLANSVMCVHVVIADATTGHRDGWAITFPTEFASASEHCISLCRLRF